MQKKIGNVTYELKPIPPSLVPYNNLLGEMTNKPPASTEEAEKWQPEIEKALKKILQACASPQPSPETEWQVFNAIEQYTQEV
jgi:Leu/Phe-tRNA-protein transferase